METFVRIIGMVMAIIPLGCLLYYMFTHIRKTSSFDNHVKRAKDNYGTKGIIVAYVTKISFGLWFTFLGILLISYFEDTFAFTVFFPFLIVYLIFKYFDVKFKKSAFYS